MSKETNDIINAFKEALLHGRQTALATVVHVEGSSYRRPGARMLVEDNGKITGAISGGCLEGDALKKALLAIAQKQNKLVVYDTLHEEDAAFGVQLGCNGKVHILFEPIDGHNPANAIELLKKSITQRKNAALVTLFSLNHPQYPQPGTCWLYDGEMAYGNLEDDLMLNTLKEEALHVIDHKSSLIKQFAEEELTAFVELIEPPISLIIVGAGNDAIPLVQMADVLGWQTTVVDGRITHANKQRFPSVEQIIVGKPAEVVKQLFIDDRTAFVLLTHNYNYDLAMIELLIRQSCGYIGVLGPKKKLDRMLMELEDSGHSLTEDQHAKIYGPTGLDIGAETAEEIALAILSEIKAVLNNRQGNSLRDRADVIHDRFTNSEEEMGERKTITSDGSR